MSAREGEGQPPQKHSPVYIVSRTMETFNISSFFSPEPKAFFEEDKDTYEQGQISFQK